MNFRPESGFDSAYLALQALGLPIRDRSQQQVQPLSTTTSLPPLPQTFTTQPHRAIGLMPSPDFEFRPTTSHGYEHRPSSSAPETPSERPSTAPMTFSQMLPPRRELPFAPILPKPQKIGAVPAAQKSSQSTTSKGKSSKTKPKKKNRATSGLGSQTDSGHPALEIGSQSCITEPKKRMNRPQPAKRKDSSHLTTTATEGSSQTQEPSSVPADHGRADTTNPKRQAEDPELSQERQTEGERDCPSPLVLKLGKKAMVAISAEESKARLDLSKPSLPEANEATPKCLSSVGEISPEEYMSRLDEWVRSYQDLPAPKPRPSPLSDLTAYAAQSEEDRLAVIDDMICEYLEDENFIKLVEDVEKSWKRIGLGF